MGSGCVHDMRDRVYENKGVCICNSSNIGELLKKTMSSLIHSERIICEPGLRDFLWDFHFLPSLWRSPHRGITNGC